MIIQVVQNTSQYYLFITMNQQEVPLSFNIFKTSKTSSAGILGAAAVSTGIASLVAQNRPTTSPFDQRVQMQQQLRKVAKPAGLILQLKSHCYLN